MKIDYSIEQARTAQGVIELDLDDEIEWQQADSDTERRAVVERAALAQANENNTWAYSHNMDFRVTPDQDGEEP